MKKQDYLTQLARASNVFECAILQEIVLDPASNTACFCLVVDSVYHESDVNAATEVSQRFVPNAFRATVSIEKRSPDSSMLQTKIYEQLRALYPAGTSNVKREDITLEIRSHDIYYTVGISPSESASVTPDKLVKVSAEVKNYYCGNFYGKVAVTKADQAVDFSAVLTEEEREPQYILPARKFKIVDYAPIDGTKMQKHHEATYIEDLTPSMPEIIACGQIRFLRERETSKGKPFFVFGIHDGTAMLELRYFSKKASLEKVRALQVGDWIIAQGSYRENNMRTGFVASFIDYGNPPDGFVPERKPSLPVPTRYKNVFPQPLVDYTVVDFFTDQSVPECMQGKTFVVFDLETTGLNYTPASGSMDHIIEIGAVKIENGKITERFSSFVKPPERLSQEIIRLTGITDEMLQDAPPYAEVLPDFLKFANGSYLVAHNARFDYGFVDYYLGKLNYSIERKLIDTVALAQDQLRLGNYKLNTVADHFGFTFNHHRAYDDALVTAKCFIELLRLKKSLPDSI